MNSQAKIHVGRCNDLVHAGGYVTMTHVAERSLPGTRRCGCFVVAHVLPKVCRRRLCTS